MTADPTGALTTLAGRGPRKSWSWRHPRHPLFVTLSYGDPGRRWGAVWYGRGVCNCRTPWGALWRAWRWSKVPLPSVDERRAFVTTCYDDACELGPHGNEHPCGQKIDRPGKVREDDRPITGGSATCKYVLGTCDKPVVPPTQVCAKHDGLLAWKGYYGSSGSDL